MTVRHVVLAGLVIAVLLAVVVSPFASSSPDGLTRVAQDQRFDHTGRLAAVQEDAPIPGYAFPGVAHERAAKGLAGLAGVVGVFALAGVVGVALRRRSRSVA